MSKTFILIHGAWHGAWCWEKLTPRLQALGHQVITPDLPGHGDEASHGARASLQSCAGAVADIMEGMDKKAVLVGHSMGGMVISQAGELRPECTEALVYLCAFLPGDRQSVFDLMAAHRAGGPPIAIERALRLSADKRSCSLTDADAAQLFYHDCAEGDRRQALARIAPQPTLLLSGRARLSARRFGALPKTYLSCLRDRVIPIAHQRRMAAAQGCGELLQLDGGHSPFYSTPDTLARLLDAHSQGAERT